MKKLKAEITALLCRHFKCRNCKYFLKCKNCSNKYYEKIETEMISKGYNPLKSIEIR